MALRFSTYPKYGRFSKFICFNLEIIIHTRKGVLYSYKGCLQDLYYFSKEVMPLKH